jgi:peptide/nickel transport system substrate-binding protein
VQTTFYNNKATEFLLFRQGKIDFINDIDASFKDEILNKNGQLKRIGWEDRSDQTFLPEH